MFTQIPGKISGDFLRTADIQMAAVGKIRPEIDSQFIVKMIEIKERHLLFRRDLTDIVDLFVKLFRSDQRGLDEQQGKILFFAELDEIDQDLFQTFRQVVR